MDKKTLLICGAASYKLTHKCKNNRGVYSFCMCPGGFVVNASSEGKKLAVNGMSYQKSRLCQCEQRFNRYGNTGSFPGTDVLRGMRVTKKAGRKSL